MIADSVAAAGWAGACSSGTASTVADMPVTRTPASGVDRTSPGPVLADWIHQVARGDFKASCRDMLEPGLSAARFRDDCPSPEGRGTLNALHANFTIDGIKPATPISAVARIAGRTATVGGDDIKVAGVTLRSLMTAHGSGRVPNSFTIDFGLTRIDDDWYITDLNINF